MNVFETNAASLRRRFQYSDAQVIAVRGNVLKDAGTAVVSRRFYVIRLTIPKTMCPTAPWVYEGVPLTFVAEQSPPVRRPASMVH